MEDLHGTHKQVPFGWVLWLQTVAKARRDRTGARPTRFERLASGLHQPSAPH
jgi:hypothetical protein